MRVGDMKGTTGVGEVLVVLVLAAAQEDRGWRREQPEEF